MSSSEALIRTLTVRVELERFGEPVHEETVVVDESEVERIESTWPSDPAEYVLRYVVFGPDEEPDVRTRTLTAEDDRADGGDCTTVAVSMGFPSGSPPYASTGTPESVGGRCPD